MQAPEWTKERLTCDDITLKPVAPNRFILIGHRTAPYIDRCGDHWHVYPIKTESWRDNLADAVQDALAREHRNKNRSYYSRNA